MLSVIIVAAGSSRRMGFDKLMAPLGGAPVLQHTINAFIVSAEVDEIIVVCPKERFEKLLLEQNNTVIRRVEGGENRHDSVSNGISAVNPSSQWIAVHDGARPLISQNQITRTLKAAEKYNAASSAKKITDTIKRADSNHFISTPVDRENLWAMETPQIFAKNLLVDAYKQVDKSDTQVTDEVSAMELIHIPTYLVSNPDPNIKITFSDDLALAEIIHANTKS